MPFSLGRSNDDKVLSNLDHFIGREVVITEKMDGENTTLYPDYIHARSIDSKNHPSRDWIKGMHSEISYKIPLGWRICGENLYAKHSIEYNELESYFYAFSVWNQENSCYNWDFTKNFCDMLGISIVPELWRGIFDEKIVKTLAAGLDTTKSEGFVMRVTDYIPYNEFKHGVAKYVRVSHVQTSDHWMYQSIIPNHLKNLLI